MLGCGVTHTAVVPLVSDIDDLFVFIEYRRRVLFQDLIKCRLQVKPQKYVNLINGFKVTVA